MSAQEGFLFYPETNRPAGGPAYARYAGIKEVPDFVTDDYSRIVKVDGAEVKPGTVTYGPVLVPAGTHPTGCYQVPPTSQLEEGQRVNLFYSSRLFVAPGEVGVGIADPVVYDYEQNREFAREFAQTLGQIGMQES